MIMNILHILYGLDMGGIQTMLVQIVNEEKKLGHRVNIIVINNMVDNAITQNLSNAIKLYKINRKPKSKNPIFLLKLNYLILKINPDIIHLHQDSIIRFVLLKKRCCITMHTIPNATNSKYINKINTIFSISKTVQKVLLNELNIKSILVYNGIKINLIKSKNRFDKNKIFKIVQIGRLLCETKGQHILINALNRIIEKGNTNVHLDIIGDGPSLKEITSLISQHNLQDYISLLGQKTPDFIHRNLHNYDLLVQPSLTEGFGLTIVEAMAAKVPVLVSSLPAPMEIINNGEFGYYFQTNNYLDCEIKILEIINKTPNKEIIEKAYKRVSDYFTIEETAKKYILEYNKIINHEKNNSNIRW